MSERMFWSNSKMEEFLWINKVQLLTFSLNSNFSKTISKWNNVGFLLIDFFRLSVLFYSQNDKNLATFTSRYIEKQLLWHVFMFLIIWNERQYLIGICEKSMFQLKHDFNWLGIQPSFFCKAAISHSSNFQKYHIKNRKYYF